MSVYHVPVLREEAIAALNLSPGMRVVDGTLGGGGHAAGIAERLGPAGLLIGIDRDPEAIAEACARLQGQPAHLHQANFADLEQVLLDEGLAQVDGVLLDLGVSSHQLDAPERGFAFRTKGPLDMRMQTGAGISAAQLLNRLPEEEIARILFLWGEEPRARRIAAQIVRARPLETTEDLVDAIRRAMPMRTRPGQIHPATKTFQAIRIAVNEELSALERGLRAAVAALASGGRLVVIAYHSLEDRIVKTTLNELAGKTQRSDFPEPEPVPLLRILTPKPVTPSEREVRQNPRARSAKMRVAERI